MATKIDALKAKLADAERELARWKVCENCGEPLAGPGICDKAISEKEKGLEVMFEQGLTERESLRDKLADAERRAARAEALVTQWRKDVADYPSATDHDAYVASVSVSMCADELAKALADPKTEPAS